MSTLTTKSVFYYGHTISETNFALDFSEGGGELQASLNIGDYSLAEYVIEIARAMNAVGGQTYSVALDRATRKLTPSAAGNFELLTTSGSRIGTTTYGLMGFSGADKTGADNYEGGAGSGSEYKPQAVLRNYNPFLDSSEAVDGAVNESTSGIIETITFGSRSFMDCEIWAITDIAQSGGSVETNATGRTDARTFMEYAITKSKMEFMEDRDTPITFNKIILERTRRSRKGIGHKIVKDFKKGVEGFYKTEALQFREVA